METIAVKLRCLAILPFVTAALMAAEARADVIAINNGGFESPAAGTTVNSQPAGPGYSYIVDSGLLTSTNNGWDWAATSTGGAGVVDGTAVSGFNTTHVPTGFYGSQYAFLQGSGASVSQTIVVPNSGIVTVSWVAAGRGDVSFTGGLGGSGFDGNATYAVTVTNGTETITDTGLTTTSLSDFAAKSFSGYLGAGTYTLSFANISGTGDHTAYIDNVIADVPEPLSLALLGTGLVALQSTRWRRQAR